MEEKQEKVAQPQVMYKPTPVLACPAAIPRSLVPKPVPAEQPLMSVRFDIPISLICNSCGTRINKGTRLCFRLPEMFNKWRPELSRNKYYLDCTSCSSELLIEKLFDGRWLVSGASRHFPPTDELQNAVVPTVVQARESSSGDKMDRPNDDEINQRVAKMKQPSYMRYHRTLRNFEEYPKKMEYLKKPFIVLKLDGNSKSQEPRDHSTSVSGVYQVSSSVTRRPEEYLKRLFSLPPTHANCDHEEPRDHSTSVSGVYQVSSSVTRRPEEYLKRLFSLPPAHANCDHEGTVTETRGSNKLGMKMDFHSG